MATSNPLPSTRHLLTSLISTIASSTKQPNEGGETSNPLFNTAATSQNTKSAFLTLHSLFPHDFLPALDLLDRGLVTRFVFASEVGEQLEEDLAGDENDNTEISRNERRRTEAIQDENQHEQRPHSEPQAKHTKNKRTRKQTILYLVRSAQRSKPSRPDYSTSTTTTTTTTGSSCEVRLKAWNCSCPAFAFAALPVDAASDSNRDDGVGGDEVDSVGYGLSGNQPDTTATAAHVGEDEVAWLGFGGLTRGKDVAVCKHLLACVVAERCQGFEQLVEERDVGAEEVAGWAAGWGD